MNPNDAAFIPAGMTRREFVQTAAATGLAMAIPAWAQETPEAKPAELAIGLIGAGSRGRYLLTKALKLPGVKFVAVCDVWPYAQRYGANILKKYGHAVTPYEDHREMLAREKHLDAVIIASPDWNHAPQTIDCMQAGKHVYCEKEMANTIEAARGMVVAARETGRKLQIGHQRRSNPRYWHALKMIEKDKILGRITHCYGQWNRANLYEQGCPKSEEIPADKLKALGYPDMDAFRNWRWYREYSGGPMADLGSHQVDVFNWFLKAKPKAVIASGGLDFYTEQEDRDWYDNVMAIYEWETAAGPVRGNYQILNTTSMGGYYETFMGTEGSMVISEDSRKGHVFREREAKRREWEDEASKVEMMDTDAIELKIGETLTPEGTRTPEAQKMLEIAARDPVELHIENFLHAIRNDTELACPADVAFEVAVSVLRANDAVESGCRYTFDPAEFTA